VVRARVEERVDDVVHGARDLGRADAGRRRVALQRGQCGALGAGRVPVDGSGRREQHGVEAAHRFTRGVRQSVLCVTPRRRSVQRFAPTDS
jgi:hypothetical protein